MKKLNGFENHLINQAITNLVKDNEEEIAKLENQKSGNRSIFASGFFTMVGKELLEKVDNFTDKEYIKERDLKLNKTK
jgi:hypothetical protein